MSLLDYTSFAPVLDGVHQLKLVDVEETSSASVVDGKAVLTEFVKLICTTETGRQITLTDNQKGFEIHMDQLHKYFKVEGNAGARQLLAAWAQCESIPVVRKTREYTGKDGKQKTAINWYLGYDHVVDNATVDTDEELPL